MSDDLAKGLILLGNGGHALVLLDCLRLCGARLIGFTTPEKYALETWESLKYLGDDEALQSLSPREVQLVNGLGSVGKTAARTCLFEMGKERGFGFASVVHPSAILAGDAVLGQGAQIMAGAILQPRCVLGDNVLVNTRAAIDHDCQIGNGVHIAPGATLSGDVQVGDGAHIGAGATIIQGVQIGRDCIVGAGAVVLRDVPPGARVAGVPAREL